MVRLVVLVQEILHLVLTEYNSYRCPSNSLCWLVIVVVVVDVLAVVVCCL